MSNIIFGDTILRGMLITLVDGSSEFITAEDPFILQIVKELNNKQIMNKDTIAFAALAQWFTTNDQVTTLDFKNYLRQNFPTEDWTQQWVSTFLMGEQLDYTVATNSNGDEYRIYISPYTSLSPDLEDLQGIVASLMVQRIDVTKTKLKSCLTAAGWSLDNFKDLFNQLGLQHTGKYTSDNHKIWTYVPSGKHLSKSKGELVDIKTMPKPYLKNAFLKAWDDGADDIDEILDDPKSEQFKLLQAYFTYDIRQSLNSL